MRSEAILAHSSLSSPFLVVGWGLRGPEMSGRLGTEGMSCKWQVVISSPKGHLPLG